MASPTWSWGDGHLDNISLLPGKGNLEARLEKVLFRPIDAGELVKQRLGSGPSSGDG